MIDRGSNPAGYKACVIGFSILGIDSKNNYGVVVMVATVSALTRFPVKGLSGESLSKVNLETGQGFPCDRQFGFARPNSGFDPKDPKPLPKTKFYMLARDAELALLNTEFDEATGRLTLSNSGNTEQFDITSDQGRKDASQFLKSYLSLADDETPQLYAASPHRFTDVSVDSVAMMNAVSIINLESVREFSKAIGKTVDPNRFRGNIHLSGMPAFEELDSVGRLLTIGTTRMKIVQRTQRCPATEVNLTTGLRDLKTPKLLREHYRHMDMGVYAEVVDGGAISSGDTAEFN